MSDIDLSSNQYWAEVASIAETLAQEAIQNNEGDKDAAEDEINDSGLHEAVDGHQLVIYYAGNDTILKHSDHEEAWEDCYGAEDIGKLVIDKGMDGACTVQAFFALEADVRDYLETALDEALEAYWKLPGLEAQALATGEALRLAQAAHDAAPTDETLVALGEAETAFETAEDDLNAAKGNLP
jgi:hypothetical protein